MLLDILGLKLIIRTRWWSRIRIRDGSVYNKYMNNSNVQIKHHAILQENKERLKPEISNFSLHDKIK